MQNRKSIITISIIVALLIVAVVGISYAYFNRTLADSSSTSVSVTASTLDELTITKGTDISIIADQTNFASGKGDLVGTTTSTVKLKAGNSADALRTYRIYVIISENTYVKTQGVAELVLKVEKGNTVLINDQDITGVSGVINVPNQSGGTYLKHGMHAAMGTETTDSIKATITFKNLDANQSANAGKSLRANIYIDESPQLPSAYQEVEYIASSGTQYIDTGIKGHMNYKYDLLFKQSNSSTVRVWGVFGQQSYVGPNMSITYAGNARAVRWESLANNQRMISEIARIDTSPHYVTIDNGVVTYDGVNKGKTQGHSDSYVINYNIYLFTINPGNTTPTSNMSGMVYSYKVRDNTGALVQSLVPCYRKSDNVIGFYDLVTGSFLVNAGTGTFTKGNNIT